MSIVTVVKYVFSNREDSIQVVKPSCACSLIWGEDVSRKFWKSSGGGFKLETDGGQRNGRWEVCPPSPSSSSRSSG